MKRAPLVLVLAAIALAATAENLTNPDFKGYLSGRGLAKGDTVFVQIDSASKLAFTASSTDSRTFTLEFSGGMTGNLFSFLPQGRTGGDRSLVGKQELSVEGRIPATVAELDAAGRALVRGSRAIEIEGREESIQISGWVDPRDVDSGRVVSFSKVADARLVYRTLLSSARDVLTPEDIAEALRSLPQTAEGVVVLPPSGAAATGAGAAATGAGAAATGAGAAATAGTSAAGTTGAAAAGTTTQPAPLAAVTLTDQKKLELLLIYLNRLVDLVFGR